MKESTGKASKILQVSRDLKTLIKDIKSRGGIKALGIGGSAGSFRTITEILKCLEPGVNVPIFICLHRLRNRSRGFSEVLSMYSKLPVKEPYDKELIRKGVVYVAPSNYHMLIESEEMIALSTTELVQYSRPSIDVLFESMVDVYKDKLLLLLLSGANRDGTRGMYWAKKHKAITVAEDTDETSISIMPQSVIQSGYASYILTKEDIYELFKKLKKANS